MKAVNKKDGNFHLILKLIPIHWEPAAIKYFEVSTRLKQP